MHRQSYDGDNGAAPPSIPARRHGSRSPNTPQEQNSVDSEVLKKLEPGKPPAHEKHDRKIPGENAKSTKDSTDDHPKDSVNCSFREASNDTEKQTGTFPSKAKLPTEKELPLAYDASSVVPQRREKDTATTE